MVVERTSETRGLVSWTQLTLSVARGFVTSYEVSYWTVGSDGLDVMSVQVPGDQTSTILAGLDNKGYYITVSAKTVVGQGDASTPMLLPLQNHLNLEIIIGAAVGALVMLSIVLTVAMCLAVTIIRQ